MAVPTSVPGEIERSLGRRYGGLLGIDEAGRGALCGPVVAAAVALPEDHDLAGLQDSKKLSDGTRRELAEEIRKQAIVWGLGRAEAREIDTINILQATFLAMGRALDKALAMRDWEPGLILVDGPYVIPGVERAQKPEIKGDARSVNIAAASILAKTARDDMMHDFHRLYPQYGFDSHVGYGTRQHREALARLGPLNEHRQTFLKK